MDKVPALRLPLIDYVPEILTKIGNVLLSGYASHGEYNLEFAGMFEKRMGGGHAFPTASASAAIRVVIRCLQASRPNANIILIPDTAFPGVYEILMAVDPDLNICVLPVSVESGLMPTMETIESIADSSHVLCFLAVYTAGIAPAHMQEVSHFLNEKNIPMIEDCSQATGCWINSADRAGTLGMASIFSFYGSKVLPIGEGGMIWTKDEELMVQVCNCSLKDGYRFDVPVDVPRENIRMPEVAAAIGTVLLKHEDEIILKRRMAYDFYFRELSKIPALHMLFDDCMWGSIDGYRLPVYVSLDDVAYAEAFSNKVYASTDRVSWQRKANVKTLSQVYGLSHSMFEAGQDYVRAHVCLPIYPGISESEVHTVVEVLKSCL
jgi:dTDP-4-amino-4,6-dideoxygalactose transaminase